MEENSHAPTGFRFTYKYRKRRKGKIELNHRTRRLALPQPNDPHENISAADTSIDSPPTYTRRYSERVLVCGEERTRELGFSADFPSPRAPY